jgi:FtsP/CotA-like multicopper oxidase with cupredoxin domain
MKKSNLLTGLLLVAPYLVAPAFAQDDDPISLQEQQIKDKIEIQKIKEEIGGVKGSMEKALQRATQVEQQMAAQKVRDFDLTCRELQVEILPGVLVNTLVYDGQSPGPVIRVKQGDPVRVALHNQLKVPTSLHFHGMILPHNVDGLPRQNAGLVGPSESYAYQFVADHPGTYFYHPQIIHSDQQARGLVGALIVEPKNVPSEADIDEVLIIGQVNPPPIPARPAALRTANGRTTVTAAPPPAVTYFTVNGKSAPSIPPLQVSQGQRVRLRLINNAQQVCPLHISGHLFNVLSFNGSTPPSPVSVDSIALQPGDRADLEFLADNPGVWSLSSVLPAQNTNNGKFPGGIAMVLKYTNVR